MKIIAAAILLALPIPANAVDVQTKHKTDPIHIVGVGQLNCTAWTQAREKKLTTRDHDDGDKVESWVQGMVTGFNLFSEGPYTVPLKSFGEDEAILLMDGQCKDHPSERIAEATGEVVVLMLRQRVQAKQMFGQ